MNTSPNACEIELNEIAVSREKFSALSRKHQFVYLLLGQIHNELMMLQKLLSFAMPKDFTTSQVLRRAETGQAMFLLRMALGKMHEAKLSLKGQLVERVLKNQYLPLLEDGIGRFDSCWEEEESSLPCLKEMRNNHGFHYPRFELWRPYLQSLSDEGDIKIYVGRQSGNTFYAASEAIAQQSLFLEIGPLEEDNRDGVEKRVDEVIMAVIDHFRRVNGLVEEIIGAYTVQHLVDKTPKMITSKHIAPDFGRFDLPFFFHMRQKAEEGNP